MEDWLRGVVEERRKVRVPFAERPSLRDLEIKVSHENNVMDLDTAAFGKNGVEGPLRFERLSPLPKKSDDSRSVR